MVKSKKGKGKGKKNGNRSNGGGGRQRGPLRRLLKGIVSSGLPRVSALSGIVKNLINGNDVRAPPVNVMKRGMLGIGSNLSKVLKVCPVKGVMGDGTFSVTHSEMIMSVNGVGDNKFNLQSLSVQPGLKAFFPWLSTAAALYDVYTIKSMTFRYETNTPTSAIGKVYLAFNRDVVYPSPYTEYDMVSMDGCVVCPVWDSTLYSVDTTNMPELYVRTGNIPVNNDQKMYDSGAFFVGVVTGQTLTGCGNLWADYTIEFRRPHKDNSTKGGTLDLSNLADIGHVTKDDLLGDPAEWPGAEVQLEGMVMNSGDIPFSKGYDSEGNIGVINLLPFEGLIFIQVEGTQNVTDVTLTPLHALPVVVQRTAYTHGEFVVYYVSVPPNESMAVSCTTTDVITRLRYFFLPTHGICKTIWDNWS